MTAPATDCRCGPHIVCPKCGGPLHFDRRSRTLIDAHEAWHRHNCDPPPVIPRIMECACGYIVAADPESGARTHYYTGRPHAEHPPPAASVVATQAEERALRRWYEAEDRASGQELADVYTPAPPAQRGPRAAQQPPRSADPAPVSPTIAAADDDLSFLEPDDPAGPAAPPRPEGPVKPKMRGIV